MRSDPISNIVCHTDDISFPAQSTFHVLSSGIEMHPMIKKKYERLNQIFIFKLEKCCQDFCRIRVACKVAQIEIN